MPWKAFEAFVADLMAALPGFSSCSSLGVEGDDQEGIDLIAPRDDGQRWVVQCRRWRQFGLKKAQRTVGEAAYPADRYVLALGREATAPVRKFFDGLPGWELWDARDLAQKVRSLPLEAGRRLVQAHFGREWRRAFLGPERPVPLVAPERFFAPLLRREHLFHHAWALVGRAAALDALEGLVTSEHLRLAVLPGRGGVGKTKLLHGLARRLAERHPGWAVRFALPGVPVDLEALEDLAGQPLVLVVDDAHGREDLGVVLEFVRRHEPPAKLVLATRPQALDRLAAQVARVGFDPSEVLKLEPLEPLARDDVRALAHQALGDGRTHLADPLVAATRDSPLVTTVGGQLLARGEVAVGLLERHAAFQDAVLSRFYDVLVGEVADRLEPERCRRVLELAAVAGPLRPNRDEVVEAGAAFLGIGAFELREALGALESAGVLLRRGGTVRLAPDVLADHVLHRACLTERGEPTGFARRAFDALAPACPEEVLRNLGELDWRVSRATGEETDLLAGVRAEIEREFEAAPNSGRKRILEVLKGAAYYQPGRVLRLVKYAVRHPATAEEPEPYRRFARYLTHESVLREAVPLLRDIAYTLELMPRCCELLWLLGRDDPRTPHAHLESPMRVLIDLTRYAHNRPFSASKAALEAVARILKQPDAHRHVHSPLDALDPAFAKAGHDTYLEGHILFMRPFALPAEGVRPIRERALELVAGVAALGEERLTLRALESLEKALDEPSLIDGQELSDAERAAWEPDQLAALDRVAVTAPAATPLVALRVERMLSWHRRRSPFASVRSRAQEIVDDLPDTEEVRLTAALVHQHPVDPYPAGDETALEAHRRSEAAVQARVEEAARAFVARHPDPGEGARALGGELVRLEAAGQNVVVSLFYAIAVGWPDYAAGLAEAAMSDPGGPLGPVLGTLLVPLRAANPARAGEIATRALDTGDAALGRGVAHAYSWDHVQDGYRPEDRPALRALLGHPDSGTRAAAFRALRAFARSHPAEALEMALAADLGGDPDTASQFCQLFDDHHGLPLSAVGDADLSLALRKLVPVESIEDYWVQGFIAKAAGRSPRAAVELLLARVERAEALEDGDYHALPHLEFDHPLVGLAGSPDHRPLLRAVRDRMLGATGMARYLLPDLYREVSLGFGDEGVAVLEEWLGSQEAAKLEATGELLRESPASLVLGRLAFVERLLDAAYSLGDGTYESVSSSLAAGVITGSRHGTSGEPFPEDIAIRDGAAAAIASYQSAFTPERLTLAGSRGSLWLP